MEDPSKFIDGDIYAVTDVMLNDLKSGKYGYHASCLGCIVGDELAKSANIPIITANTPATDELCSLARYMTRGDLTESIPQGRGSSGRRPGSRSASSTPSKRRRAGGARHSHSAVGRLPQGRERADGRHPSRVEAELDAIETITSTSSAQPVLAHHRAIETNHKERSPHVETRAVDRKSVV